MKNSDIEKLVAELEKRIKLILNKEKRGHLYHALKLIAEFDQKNINDFIIKYHIEEQCTLYEDEQILIKLLDFPKGDLNESKLTKFFRNIGILPRKNKYELLIKAADSIVQHYSKPKDSSSTVQQSNVSNDSKSVENYQQAVEPTNHTPPLPVAKDLKVRNLSIALVLKGNQSEKLSNHILDLNQLKMLLGNASHFICASKAEVSKIEQELNLTSEIDRESEQAVLMVINYEGKLEEGKNFVNKLELNQHLRKQNSQYTVVTIKRLLEVDNLCKLGFVRS